jgi:16S rRNA (cytidine1402-2'-O)-methyltransferase
MPGTLFVVATPIGNLEDITLRALRVLREVSLIAAEDTRRTARLLAHYAITTPTTSLHEHNESKKAEWLIRKLEAGEQIALVSDAGTPAVSDPGGMLIAAAFAANVRVEPIPGANAIATLLSSCGLSTNTYLFLGFPPVRSKDRLSWIQGAMTAEQPVVFFEAPHRITRTLEELGRMDPERFVVVGRELTKAHEELVRGPIRVVLPRFQMPRGEFVILISAAPPGSGLTTEIGDDELLHQFVHMTEKGGTSRRQAIAELARRYGQGTNDVYDALERAKKSAR